MCGIAGIISTRGESTYAALCRMTAAMSHRGPDDSGQYTCSFGTSQLMLGHRRLSILDTTCAGHQPMIHPDSGDVICFNGEIYNFAELREDLEKLGERFTGHSDTEILLHGLTRWGPDFISRLNGMFAFAFFNKARQELLLARDSAGIKPLYVAQAAGEILFASEIRALLASGMVDQAIDRRGLAGFMAFGSVQRPYTLFEQISEFESGTYQIISADGSRRTTRFWNFPRPDPSLTFEDVVPEIRQRLAESVRDQMVADVPVGIFLSSGIDSTLIAALASSQREGVRAFTVGFADQPDLSEQSIAAETARGFGIEHTAIDINAADTLTATQNWLGSLDQPSVDGLNVFIISQAIRNQGIKVALAGNGGDELFAGYTIFWEIPLMLRLMGYTRWLPRRVRSNLAYAGVSMLGRPQAVKEKAFDIAGVGSDIVGLYLQRRRAMSSAQLKSLGLNPPPMGVTADFIPSTAMQSLSLEPNETTWNLSALECHFYQTNMLLRDADANGMAHGLEIRVPLLDQRMLEFAHRIPSALRSPPGAYPKYLLRAAFGSLLGRETLSQRKRGFVLPLRRWMIGPLRDLCEESLGHLKSTGLFRPQGIDSVWSGFLREPESAVWSRAFSLCVLGTYMRKMRIA